MKLTEVPMYLKDLRFSTETVDDEERKVVVVTLQLNPFNKALALKFVPGMVSTLFNGDAKPADDLETAGLKLHAEEYLTMEVRKAPDLKRPTMEIVDVKLEKALKVKVEEDTRYSATFRASFRYPEAKDLLTLATAFGTQVWVSFIPQQGSLLVDEA